MAERVEREPAVWLLAPDILTAQALLIRLPPNTAEIVMRDGDRRVEVWMGGRDSHAEAVAGLVQTIIRWVDAEQLPAISARVWGVEQTFVSDQRGS